MFSTRSGRVTLPIISLDLYEDELVAKMVRGRKPVELSEKFRFQIRFLCDRFDNKPCAPHGGSEIRG